MKKTFIKIGIIIMLVLIVEMIVISQKGKFGKASSEESAPKVLSINILNDEITTPDDIIYELECFEEEDGISKVVFEFSRIGRDNIVYECNMIEKMFTGKYRIKIPIDEYISVNEYALRGVYVHDMAENVRIYFPTNNPLLLEGKISSYGMTVYTEKHDVMPEYLGEVNTNIDSTQCVNNGNFKVMVSSKGENDMPLITSLNVVNQDLSINDKVKIEFSLHEQGSGLKRLYFVFEATKGSDRIRKSFLCTLSQTITDGVYTIEFPLDQYLSNVKYNLVYFLAQDASRNTYMNWGDGSEGELSSFGTDQNAYKYDVNPIYLATLTDTASLICNVNCHINMNSNPFADEEAPQLYDLSMKNSIINAPDALEYVFALNENNSGLKYVFFVYEGKNNKRHNVKCTFEEPVLSGVYSIQVPVNEYAEGDEVRLLYLYLEDMAGNQICYGRSHEDDMKGEVGTTGTLTNYTEYAVEALPVNDKLIEDIQKPSGLECRISNVDYKINTNKDLKFRTMLENPKLLGLVDALLDGENALIQYENSTIVLGSLFQLIQGKDVNIVFQGKGIQWVINGKGIQKNEIKDIDLSTDMQVINGNEYGLKEDVLQMDFADNGVLPANVEIRFYSLYALKKHKNKDVLYLNWLDGKTLKAEPSNVEKEKDLMLEFNVNHNSKFLLSTEKVGGEVMPTITPTASPTAKPTVSPSSNSATNPMITSSPDTAVTKMKQLSKPSKLKLTVKKATWKNVANNSGYTLKIMRGKKVVKTMQIKKGKTSYKIPKKLFKKGKKYKFTIVAKGKGKYKNSKVATSKVLKIKK